MHHISIYIADSSFLFLFVIYKSSCPHYFQEIEIIAREEEASAHEDKNVNGQPLAKMLSPTF